MTITIDTNIWVTIVIAVLSVLASSLVTWYFSRRHYSRPSESNTEHDVALMNAKRELVTSVLKNMYWPMFLLIFAIVMVMIECRNH